MRRRPCRRRCSRRGRARRRRRRGLRVREVLAPRVTAMSASCCGIAAMGVFRGEVRPVYGRLSDNTPILRCVSDTSEASMDLRLLRYLAVCRTVPPRRSRRGPRRPTVAEPADPATRDRARLRPLRSLHPRTLAHRRRPGVPPRRRRPTHARDPGERHRPLDRARDGVGSHGRRRADHRGRRDLPSSCTPALRESSAMRSRRCPSTSTRGRAQRADFAVGTRIPPAELRSMVLGHAYLWAQMPAWHPFASRPNVPIAELVQEPLIVMSRAHEVRQMLDSAAARAGLAFTAAVETTSPVLAQALAAAGAASACSPTTRTTTSRRRADLGAGRRADHHPLRRMGRDALCERAHRRLPGG